tara:strand:+ start:40 stop:1254 length:1215 start_codon:yes stop_codon:yes gene_type:complete
MFNKSNFFNKFFLSSKKFNENLKKTKKVFENFKSDFENLELPLLDSYAKGYEFDFSQQTIKKFLKFQNIVIIGMGGSILGSKAIYSFFKKKVKKNLFFFDNLDSDLFSEFKKIRNIKSSCFIIISKSGNTIETLSNLGIIFSKFSLKGKLVFITEFKANSLTNIANKLNSEIIEYKDYIGGRYSVLSEVGMFPAALMGLNINKFRNLEKIIRNKKFVSALIHNIAAIYTLRTQGTSNSIILNYDSSLNDLGSWYQQLVAESLGKEKKGINAILSSVPKDHHSLLQLYLDGPRDKFFTFFNSMDYKKSKLKVSKKIISNNTNFLKNKSLEFIVNAQSKATKRIFYLKKIPFRQFTFKKNNEEELGMIFTFFVLETIILARMMNINPFDQPAVEQVKIEIKKILSN